MLKKIDKKSKFPKKLPYKLLLIIQLIKIKSFLFFIKIFINFYLLENISNNSFDKNIIKNTIIIKYISIYYILINTNNIKIIILLSK